MERETMLTNEKASLPECVAQYAGVEFDAIPTLAELHTLYSRYGTIERHRKNPNCFALVRVGKSVTFPSREQAWDYWLKHRDCLELLVKPCDF